MKSLFKRIMSMIVMTSLVSGSYFTCVFANELNSDEIKQNLTNTIANRSGYINNRT